MLSCQKISSSLPDTKGSGGGNFQSSPPLANERRSVKARLNSTVPSRYVREEQKKDVVVANEPHPIRLRLLVAVLPYKILLLLPPPPRRICSYRF